MRVRRERRLLANEDELVEAQTLAGRLVDLGTQSLAQSLYLKFWGSWECLRRPCFCFNYLRVGRKDGIITTAKCLDRYATDYSPLHFFEAMKTPAFFLL